MKTKTYTAPTFREALLKVKAEMGASALIIEAHDHSTADRPSESGSVSAWLSHKTSGGANSKQRSKHKGTRKLFRKAHSSGAGRGLVEVVAAYPLTCLPWRHRQDGAQAAGRAPDAPPNALGAAPALERDGDRPLDGTDSALDERPVRVELGSLGRLAARTRGDDGLSAVPAQAGRSVGSDRGLQKELEDIKGILQTLTSLVRSQPSDSPDLRLQTRGAPVCRPDTGRQDFPGVFQQLYSILVDHEVEFDLAKSLLEKAMERLPVTDDQAAMANDQSPMTNEQGAMTNDQAAMTNDQSPMSSDQCAAVRESGQHGDQGVALQCLMSEIQESLKVKVISAPNDGDQNIVAFIGPTGVGKTTTIAKLAANYSIKEKINVALITIDTYRVAAVEQLRAYADMIGLPIKVVFTPEELKRAVKGFADAPIIFIDTIGRSHLDQMKVQELRGFLSVLEGSSLETHLVISATTKQRDVLDIFDGFNVMPIDKLVFTKIDETKVFGPILNVARRVDLPLSYLTTGQEVPDDIEAANPRRIAELLLNDQYPAAKSETRSSIPDLGFPIANVTETERRKSFHVNSQSEIVNPKSEILTPLGERKTH